MSQVNFATGFPGSGCGSVAGERAQRNEGAKIDACSKVWANFLRFVRNLREERAEDGNVRPGRNFTAQVGVDHPSARIDGHAVTEFVRGVENGPGRIARGSFDVLA